MRAVAALILLLAASPLAAQTADSFDGTFAPRIMRVDYFHTGGKGLEVFSLDRIVDDGPWAGSRTRQPHVPRVAALSVAEQARPRGPAEAAARSLLRRSLVGCDRSGVAPRQPRAARAGRRRVDAFRKRRPRGQGGPRDPRRRLHRRRRRTRSPPILR
ncbi:MAG: hypothetical protein HYU53_10660 [Acidobacteria bacterium]|nr:hypothetical protein [Acidobacteriota bacterium]